MKRQIYIYSERIRGTVSKIYTYGNQQGLWFKKTKKSSKTYHSRVKSLSKLYYSLISFGNNDEIELDFDQKWDEFMIDWYKLTT